MRRRDSSTRSTTSALMTRRIVSCCRRGGGTSRLARRRLRQRLADHRQMREVGRLEQLRAQAVVEVVAVIGDVVGQRGDLRLRRGIGVQRQRMSRVVFGDIGGRLAQRAVVLGQALQRLPAQVEPVEGGVAALQQRHHAQALRIVIEAAERLHGQRPAPPPRHGRTAGGRGRGRAPAPRSGPRRVAVRARPSGRSATPPGCASAGCGRSRPRG